MDSEGNLANWSVPNKFTPGMGGAMDLVVGAKKVIVVMEHTSKGQIKIVEKCNLPLTASCEVNLIITEKCVFRVLKNSDGTPDGLLLEEINPMFTVDDIKKTTGCDFKISEKLVEMEV